MNYKTLYITLAFVVCGLTAIASHVVYGVEFVYTHLFYIPIILTGIWYPRYAVGLAALLGAVHIACDYETTGAFRTGAFFRAAIFIVVASVTAYLAFKRDSLFNELEMLNNAMLDMISKVDINGVFEYVSPSVNAVLGYKPEELKGKLFFDFIHPEDAPAVRKKFQNASDQRVSFRLDYRHRCADGRYIWIESLANPIGGSHKGMKVFAFGSRDITIRKQAEENLKHLSIHDPLTGLYNRFMFEEELRRFGTGRFDPVGIVMCDLDGLKLVNDNLGHEAGDRLLIAAGNLLREQFRATDIVARIGGDEFAVLLAQCPAEMVRDICDRLKQTMAEKNIPDAGIPFMMSVGYAIRDRKEVPLEDMIRQADLNMYREKIKNRQSFLDLFSKSFPRQDLIWKAAEEKETAS